MHHDFDKKNPVISETFFPTAQEMLGETKLPWPLKTSEEILSVMQEEKADGKRSAQFLRCMISPTTIYELQQKGFWVSCSSVDDCPCFKILW